MINFVTICLNDSNFHPAHEDLNRMLNEGWAVIGHSKYSDTDFEDTFLHYERYTLYRQDEGVAVYSDNLTTTLLMSIERDQTKSSGSPMWRCRLASGETVNIFKHDDPDKDTFHLLDEGWQTYLMSMQLYALEEIAAGVPVTITKTADGRFNELVSLCDYWETFGEDAWETAPTPPFVQGTEFTSFQNESLVDSDALMTLRNGISFDDADTQKLEPIDLSVSSDE